MAPRSSLLTIVGPHSFRYLLSGRIGELSFFSLLSLNYTQHPTNMMQNLQSNMQHHKGGYSATLSKSKSTGTLKSHNVESSFQRVADNVDDSKSGKSKTTTTTTATVTEFQHVSSTFMSINDSGISGNSEWVLFDNPFYGVGDGDNDGDEVITAHEADSVLSTRSTGFYLPEHQHIRGDYVFSDFSATPTSENDIDLNLDQNLNLNGAARERDGDLVSEQDSLVRDVRVGLAGIHRRQSEVMEGQKQKDLIMKINDWKSHSMSTSSNLQGIRDSDKYRDKILSSAIKAYQLGKLDKSGMSIEQVYALRKAITKMRTALTIDDRMVEKEGVFMNNPDLESCIPGYWKRVMLDNIITETDNVVTGVAIEDINAMKRNKNFWETEESSTQSISTGWEGNWV